MPSNISILDLFKAGVHFGHQVSRWHPKMKPFIFTQKNGVHIINLEITEEKIKTAHEFIKKIIANGGMVLFVSTKKQAQPIIVKYAKEVGMPYVTERWLGGTFTNFAEVRRLVQYYITLKQRKESGDLASKYTKKEQLKFAKEMEKLQRVVSGIVDLKKLPEAIFVVDIKTDTTTINEAHKKEIPIVAICDSNVNPDMITYPIPGNDDGIKSIELITSYIASAVKEGLEERSKKQPAKPTAKAK